MRIAFLGLGNMGSAMASRLLAAGHPLVVREPHPGKSRAACAHGRGVGEGPGGGGRGVRGSVVTSLMDDASMRNMFDVSGAVFAALRPGAIHLCVTTIPPHCAEWLESTQKERGVFYVSGPVLGRPDAAKAGKLVQFLSGDWGRDRAGRADLPRLRRTAHPASRYWSAPPTSKSFARISS